MAAGVFIRLFGTGPFETRLLLLLSVPFMLAAAVAVVLASTAKALLIFANPLTTIPRVSIAASLFTMVVAALYVAMVGRIAVWRQRAVLFGCSTTLILACRLAYEQWPELASMALSVLVTGICYLLAQEVASLSQRLLTARQARRLYPGLAATSTVGAALGGGLVQVLARFVAAEDLLFLALVLMALLFAMTLPLERRAVSEVGKTPVHSFRTITEHPVLLGVAAFVFFAQVAAVLVDYAFSGELKATLQKDEMARFLGSFMLFANVLVIVVSLLVTSRLLVVFGVGTTFLVTAVLVALASLAYGGLAFLGVGPAFLGAAAAELAVHVGQHSTTRSASLSAMAPLDQGLADRGRGMIDGVVARLAIVVASLGLAVAGLEVGQLVMLVPAIVLACGLAVVVGLRLDRHYRQALITALREKTETALPLGEMVAVAFGRRGLKELERQLESGDPVVATQALSLVKDMRIPVRPELLERLCDAEDAMVRRAALAAIRAKGLKVAGERLLRLLDPRQPPQVLLEAMLHLPPEPAGRLAQAVQRLCAHEDPAVQALATLSLHRLATSDATMRFYRAVHSAADEKLGAGYQAAVDFARSLLARIESESSVEERVEAIRAIAVLGLPMFIEPLVGCLAQRALRPHVAEALRDFREGAVGPLREVLREKEVAPVARVAVHRVLEAIGTAHAMEVLLEEVGRGEMLCRTHAAGALWRASRANTLPPREAVEAAVLGEVELLRKLLAVRSCLQADSPRMEVVVDAVEAAMAHAGRRALLLMGLLYDRTAMYHALLHYRSKDRRTRANAIELIEQHVRGQKVEAIVGLMEGRLEEPCVGGDLGALLSSADPLLGRLWAWAKEGAVGVSWEDPLDRILILRKVPLLAPLSPDALLGLAQVASLCRLHAGEVLFQAGDEPVAMYLLLQGELAVWRSGREVARVGPLAVVGEVALFHGVPYGSKVEAVEDAEVVLVPSHALKDLYELHPEVGREVVKMVARRLFAAISRLGGP